MQTTGRFVRFLFQALVPPRTPHRFRAPSTGLSFCRRSRILASASPFRGLSPNSATCQQSQRPVGVPLPPLVQGDDPGFRLAVFSAPAASASVPAPASPSTKFRRTTVFVRHENASAGRSARRRRSSKGARRIRSLPPLRIVSRRISRSPDVSRTSCIWECLSVARTLDRWHYMSILRQCTRVRTQNDVQVIVSQCRR